MFVYDNLRSELKSAYSFCLIPANTTVCPKNPGSYGKAERIFTSSAFDLQL
jgi:hypothetical protein